MYPKATAYGVGWAALAWVLAYPLNSSALSSDRDKPMHIEADSAELDERKGVSVYRGNVNVKQGTMVLNADTLTVKNRNRNIIKIVAEGKPAHFQQRPDNQDEDVKADANRIEYLGKNKQILLLGDAKVWQAGNVFQSDRIEYDMNNNVVNAGGERSELTDERRVRITIQPDTNTDSNNNSANPDTQ